jgi:hypothetical protein
MALSTANTCTRCNNPSFLQITIHFFKHISVTLSPIRISMIVLPQCNEKMSIALTVHKMRVCKFQLSKSRLLFLLLLRLSEFRNRSSPKHVITPKRRRISKYKFYLHFQRQLITATTSLRILLQLWITLHCDSKDRPHWTWIKITDKILFSRTILRRLEFSLLLWAVLLIKRQEETYLCFQKSFIKTTDYRLHWESPCFWSLSFCLARIHGSTPPFVSEPLTPYLPSTRLSGRNPRNQAP